MKKSPTTVIERGEQAATKALPHTATVRITPPSSKTVDWSIRFSK